MFSRFQLSEGGGVVGSESIRDLVGGQKFLITEMSNIEIGSHLEIISCHP